MAHIEAIDMAEAEANEMHDWSHFSAPSPSHAPGVVTAGMVNAAWNEGKRRGMTGDAKDFRMVLSAALASLSQPAKGERDGGAGR